MHNDTIYWIWLSEMAGQGSKLAVKLINIFGNAKNVYLANKDEINDIDTPGLNTKEIEQARKIISDKSLDLPEKILSEAKLLGQHVLVPTDENFPKSLLNLRDAPMVLYVLGILPRLNRDLCISVVGTRKMSDYGRKAAFSLGYGLGAGGAVVISGMALGADSMAMTGAIMAGGSTVAVLGGGVDVVYPKDHTNLYYTILKNGSIISEYPPGTRPMGYHFPVRNRIISGLSAATVIVEADSGSGALITARHAAYQGRTIFAVPGEIGALGAEGTNNLIKDGALVATGAEDVLAEYEFMYPHSVSIRAMRSAVKGIDMSEASDNAMKRLRIVSRQGSNFYGTGVYGGKSNRRHENGDLQKKNSDKLMKKIKPDNLKVKMGADAERISSGKKPEDESNDRIEFDMLDEINIKVYNIMTPDVPVIPDELVRDDISISDVLSSLSMLELAGVVEAGAGGYFLRRSSDDIVYNNEDERI